MRALLPLQLQENLASGIGAGSGFHQIPIEGSTPDRPELSEAECDIDTLKKLKLGLRSSLWSRPSSTVSSVIQQQQQQQQPQHYHPQQHHPPQQQQQQHQQHQQLQEQQQQGLPAKRHSDYSIAV